MAKPPKTTPTKNMTKAQVETLKDVIAANTIEGVLDQSGGKDTRMSRDGGTMRRLRR